MKKLLTLAFLLSFWAMLQTTVSAQDLSMRQAAYFQFYSDGKIDLKTPYVTPGKTFTINKGAGKYISDGKYTFAIGFILFRDKTNFAGVGNAFKVDVIGESSTSSLVFGFKGDDKTTQAGHETPPLKMGLNKLKVVIDSTNKYAETNENNNSFEFYVQVVENEKPKIILKPKVISKN